MLGVWLFLKWENVGINAGSKGVGRVDCEQREAEPSIFCHGYFICETASSRTCDIAERGRDIDEVRITREAWEAVI
jgi:hypothetical protein